MSIFIRLMTLLAFVALPVLFLEECQTSRQPHHDFVQVPIENVMSGLSEEQRWLVSSKGQPDVVWQKPFDVFLWAYCTGGEVVDRYEFDARGMLMDFHTGGSSSLCEKQLQSK